MLNWLLGLIPSWVPWAIIGFGIALFILVQFLQGLIPVLYRYFAVIAIELIGVFLFATGFYIDGRRDVLVNEESKINQIVSDQKGITKQALDDYINSHQATKAKNEKIIKYITTKDNGVCVLPQSFISVHNMAATNTIPGASTGVNATGTGVTGTTGK